jgi:hypothetical protein
MDRNEIKALAEVAATVGTPNATGKSAFAQLIVETIEPNRITPDLFSLFLPVRSLNVGDQLVKKVHNRGFPVRTFVPGTNHLADQFVPPREVLTYMVDYMITKTRYSLWELRRGELPALQNFQDEMQKAMIDTLVSKVWNLLSTVWTATNTPNNYVTVSTAVTQPVLDAMIEQVLYYAGNVRSITGTRKALMPIYKFAGIIEHAVGGSVDPTRVGFETVDTIIEEWRRTGRITSYMGIPLVELPQVFEHSADNYWKKLIAEDQIMVIGDKAGEIITYGGVETQEYTDFSTEPAEYSLAMWRGWGMIVDMPENIGIIKIV